jgi:Nucleotidyl transferase AbiEii toxin, Type IV TA system
LSDEAQRALREVQAYFRLPSIGLVEKDQQVVRAIAALAALNADPFTLVFGGGTALARAHKLIRRMSEDVDFKVVPTVSITRSALRRQLGRLRAQVSAALQGAGFAFDAADTTAAWSMNENHYAVWQLPYASDSGAGEGLRPTIKVELNYAPLRCPAVTLPVQSFVAEAFGRPAEAPAVACVGVLETAAEKLVSLTRRTGMEMAGAGREPDPTLVRHIYDLHMLRALIEPAAVATLAQAIAVTDAQEFASQYPAYAADIPGETRKALAALQGEVLHRERYIRFLAAMVYGEQPAFETAVATVADLADRAWPTS